MLVVVVCVQVRKRCLFVLVGVATRKDFTVGQPLVKIEKSDCERDRHAKEIGISKSLRT